MITAYLIDDAKVLEQLRALPNAIGSGLLLEITRLGIELQHDVQENKLSGQVLRSRSGSLRSSIDLEIGQRGSAVTANVSTDSRYGAAQEYGFAGTVSVRASLRRIREAFGRPIAERTIDVRAYDHRMDLSEHSFLRSALQEMTPAILDGIEAVLAEAVSR